MMMLPEPENLQDWSSLRLVRADARLPVRRAGLVLLCWLVPPPLAAPDAASPLRPRFCQIPNGMELIKGMVALNPSPPIGANAGYAASTGRAPQAGFKRRLSMPEILALL